jgi:hypothetical protein
LAIELLAHPVPLAPLVPIQENQDARDVQGVQGVQDVRDVQETQKSSTLQVPDLFGWSVDLHNAVNLRLKKPVLTRDQAYLIHLGYREVDGSTLQIPTRETPKKTLSLTVRVVLVVAMAIGVLFAIGCLVWLKHTNVQM